MSDADPIARSARGSLVRLSAREYHADPCPAPSLSSSVANVLLTKSPLHAWLRHPRLGGQAGEATDATDRGTLIHSLVLGTPFPGRVIDCEDFRSKPAREARDNALSLGLIPVKVGDMDPLERVAGAIKDEIEYAGIRLLGHSEAVATWEEDSPVGPVSCRGMLDHVWMNDIGAGVFDLKTCRSAHPRACEKHVVEYGYDLQAAAYVSAIETIRPDLAGRVSFTWLFIEELPGFRVALTVATLAGSMWERGRRRWARAVELWANCLAADKWPTYSAEPVRLECPAWAMDAEDAA